MTDKEARDIRRSVTTYLNEPQGQGFDIGNPRHFEQLMACISQPSTVGTVADDARWVVTAMCVLNLGAHDIPPGPMRQALLKTVQRYTSKRHTLQKRVMECAVAYGCGLWRTVEPTQGPTHWDQAWDGALRALTRAIEPAVDKVNRWLARHVIGFAQMRQDRDPWSDAWMLMVRLTRPEHILLLGKGEELNIVYNPDAETAITTSMANDCRSLPPGTKAVWTVHNTPTVLILPGVRDISLQINTKVIVTARDADAWIRVVPPRPNPVIQCHLPLTASVYGPTTLALWECTCGTTHCRERHRLEAWNPLSVTLWAFVASAVKGPHPVLHTGSFVAGMYFPLFAQEDW